MASKTKKQETLMKYLAQDLHLYEQLDNQTRQFLESKELQLKEELNDPNIISESALKLTKVIQVLRPQIDSLLLVSSSDHPTSSSTKLTNKNGVIATHDEEDTKLESLRAIFLKDPDQFEALKLVLSLRNQKEDEEEELVKKKRPNWRWAFYGFVAKTTINALLDIAKTYYNLDDLFGIEKTTKNRPPHVVEDDGIDKSRKETTKTNRPHVVEDVDAKNQRKRKMNLMLEAFYERNREKKLKRKETKRKRKSEKRMADAVAVAPDEREGKPESDLNVDDSRMIVPQMNVDEADVDVKKKIAETSKESKKKRKLKFLTAQRKKRKLEAVENAASDLNVDDSQVIVAQMNVVEADSDVNVKKNIPETFPKSKKWSLEKLAEKRKKRLENRKARAMAKKEREDKVESDLNADDSQMIVAQMSVNEADADVNVKKKIPETSKEREEEEPEQVNGKEEEEEVGEEIAQAVAEDEREDKVESDLNVDDSQMIVAQINVDEVDADINVKKKIQETSKEREEEEPEQFKRKEEVGEKTHAVAEDERDDKAESVTLGGQTRSAEGK